MFDICGMIGLTLGGVCAVFWPFKRHTLVLDPIGWDPKARQVHDVSLLGQGSALLHHSTCWCRTAD